MDELDPLDSFDSFDETFSFLSHTSLQNMGLTSPRDRTALPQSPQWNHLSTPFPEYSIVPEESPFPVPVATEAGTSRTNPRTEKRKRTSVVCVPCFKAKVKCNAQRPCKRCVQRGIAEECISRVQKRRIIDTDLKVSLYRGQRLGPLIPKNSLYQLKSRFSSIVTREWICQARSSLVMADKLKSYQKNQFLHELYFHTVRCVIPTVSEEERKKILTFIDKVKQYCCPPQILAKEVVSIRDPSAGMESVDIPLLRFHCMNKRNTKDYVTTFLANSAAMDTFGYSMEELRSPVDSVYTQSTGAPPLMAHLVFEDDWPGFLRMFSHAYLGSFCKRPPLMVRVVHKNGTLIQCIAASKYIVESDDLMSYGQHTYSFTPLPPRV